MNQIRSSYTIWEQTPLKWHKFITYIGLPIGVLLSLSKIPEVFSTMKVLIGTGLEWVGAIDIAYTVCMPALSVAAIIGNRPSMRRWFGPCCVMLSYGVSILYSIFALVLSLWGGTFIPSGGTYIGQAIAYAVALLLVHIYYRKRRLLFDPVPVYAVKESTAPIHPETPVQSEAPVHSDDNSSCTDLLMRLQGEALGKAEASTQCNPEPAQSKKQQRAAPVWLAAVLSCGCIALAVACIVLGIQGAQIRAERDALAEEKAAMESDFTILKHQKDELYIETLQLQNQLSRVSEAQLDNGIKANFLMNNIGLIVEGSPYYHTYDCEVFQDSSVYLAHNVEYCRYLGYTKCSACHDIE